MGYQVLARKYRPQRFADVAGQDHVTRTLLNALSQNRIAHGYIFSGHRGIGKTTIARILAQALNCRTAVGTAERPTPEPCGICDSCSEIRQGSAVDVIEIDAATNRGIDEIRELRDAARYAPARDRYKIYILDEAHQITEAAFNALLKTLEEPPAHVIFMMATTEPENIPQTIRSRCQHFSFHAVRFDDILEQLRKIAREEQVGAEDAALALLAEAGDGSMRDALSIMDQAIASAPVQDDRPVLAAGQIRDLMGSVPQTVFERLMEAAAQGESIALMEQLNILLNAGHSPSSLARQMVRYLRNALMAKLGGEQTELLQISGDERARAARTAMLFTEEELTRNLQIMLRTFDDLNFRQEQRFHLELGLMKLVHAQRLLPLEELLSALGGKSLPGKTSANPSPTPAQRPLASTARSASASPAAPAAAPSISPFGSAGGNWGPNRTMESSTKPVSSGSNVTEMPRPISAPASEPQRVTLEAKAEPVVAATPTGFTSSLTEGSLAKAPENAPAGGAVDAETMRQAVVSALEQGGHSSASQLLGAATWSVEGSSVRIETAPMGKKMLSLTVNATSEKIIRQELQRLGAPSRFLVVPGAGAAPAGSVSMAAPMAGSVQEAALAHPMVQKAKELFKAEVRSVVDLRSK